MNRECAWPLAALTFLIFLAACGQTESERRENDHSTPRQTAATNNSGSQAMVPPQLVLVSDLYRVCSRRAFSGSWRIRRELDMSNGTVDFWEKKTYRLGFSVGSNEHGLYVPNASPRSWDGPKVETTHPLSYVEDGSVAYLIVSGFGEKRDVFVWIHYNRSDDVEAALARELASSLVTCKLVEDES